MVHNKKKLGCFTFRISNNDVRWVYPKAEGYMLCDSKFNKLNIRMENVGTEEKKNVTRSRTKDMKVESRRNIRDDPCKEVRPSDSVVLQKDAHVHFETFHHSSFGAVLVGSRFDL